MDLYGGFVWWICMVDLCGESVWWIYVTTYMVDLYGTTPICSFC